MSELSGKQVNILLSLLPFWLFVFLFKFAAGLHYTLLPVIGEHVLPIWAVGFVIGAASLLQLIFDVPAGMLLDRTGYIRTMFVSTSIFLLGVILLVFDFSISTYVISVFMGFIGWLFYGPGINAYTLSNASSEKGGRYMGIQHSFQSLGIVCSSLLLTLIVHKPISQIAIILSIIFILSLLALINAKKDRASLSEIEIHRKRHPHYLRKHFIGKIIREIKHLSPPALVLALQNLSSSIFYSVIWFTIPLVIATQGGSQILGIGLSIFDLAIVLFGVFLGKLADRYYKKTLIFTGLLLFSVTSLFIGFNFNIIFLVLGFLATTGDEMSDVSLWSWIEKIDSNHEDDGVMNGAIILFEDIGWTIGPVVAGVLFTFGNPSLVILIGALPITAVWMFSIFFLRNKKEPVHVSSVIHGGKPIRSRHKK